MPSELKRRCHLVYALAPEAIGAREANDCLNEYIADRRRGIAVFHDHFTGRPRGGIAVWEIRSEEEHALLLDPGPLEGWELRIHPLMYSLATGGFAALIDLNLARFAGTSLARLAAEEEQDERFWWRQH
ncbi:MAG TPA: hypothetical protein VF002_08910 [Gaiellaceae bacterium]